MQQLIFIPVFNRKSSMGPFQVDVNNGRFFYAGVESQKFQYGANIQVMSNPNIDAHVHKRCVTFVYSDFQRNGFKFNLQFLFKIFSLVQFILL